MMYMGHSLIDIGQEYTFKTREGRKAGRQDLFDIEHEQHVIILLTLLPHFTNVVTLHRHQSN